MRKLFNELRAHVERFLEQRGDLTLIVPAGQREYVALCATLSGMDEGGSRHVFLIFGEAFETPSQYATALLSAYEVRHRELVQTMKPPPGELPRVLYDDRNPAGARIRSLLGFARELLSGRPDLLLVVGLVPSAIADAAAFARFVDELLEHDVLAPWCRGMRFVVREDVDKPALSRERRERTRTRYYAPDLSDDRLVRALEEEANDASEPLPMRMQSLMISAGMDSSFRRTESALQKYELLANYYLGLGELPRLALALNGMGEACALAGQVDAARAHFERALTPALEAKDLPSLISITFNLARLHQGQSDWQKAGEYYDALSTLARASLNAALQVVCHEQHGAVLQGHGKNAEALQQWRAGVTLTHGMGMRDQQLGLLLRIRELIAPRAPLSEVRKVDDEIAALRRAGAHELPRT